MTLRVGSPDDIRMMFGRMNTERQRIIKALIQLVYFMRGSIQYESMKNTTAFERQQISEFIDSRIEVEKNKPPTQVY